MALPGGEALLEEEEALMNDIDRACVVEDVMGEDDNEVLGRKTLRGRGVTVLCCLRKW